MFQVSFTGGAVMSLFLDGELPLLSRCAPSLRWLLRASPVLKGDKRRRSLKAAPHPPSPACWRRPLIGKMQIFFWSGEGLGPLICLEYHTLRWKECAELHMPILAPSLTLFPSFTHSFPPPSLPIYFLPPSLPSLPFSFSLPPPSSLFTQCTSPTDITKEHMIY